MKTTVLRIILIVVAAAVLLVTSVAATRFEVAGTPEYNTATSGNIFLYIAAIGWVAVTGWIMATHRRYRIRA
jgi:hypothetical protein